MLARRVIAIVAAVLLTACASRMLATVQRAHGRELRCSFREVRAERVEGERWISRGCGFEADWVCRGGECTLVDARSHGMAAP